MAQGNPPTLVQRFGLSCRAGISRDPDVGAVVGSLVVESRAIRASIKDL